MKPGGTTRNLQGLSNIPILSRINPIPHTDPCFLKIFFCNTAFISTPSLPRGLFPVSLPVKMLKVLLTLILAVCPAHILHLVTLKVLAE